MYPSQGSMLGGTLLTIRGKYFDQTDGPAMVLVGGIKLPFLLHCSFDINVDA